MDAKLGGSLLNKRMAKGHKGESGGLRTIIAYRQEHRLIFLFGFAKRDRANIDHAEKRALQELGNIYMAMSEKEMSDAIGAGTLLEVRCDGEEETESNFE